MFNPLRLNSDLSQTSHCNIKGLSVSELVCFNPVTFNFQHHTANGPGCSLYHLDSYFIF